MYSYPHKTAYYPVARSVAEPYLSALSGKSATLYLHIPFCRTKCGYCNLFSIAATDPHLFGAYASAIDRQMDQLDRLINFETVDFQSLTLGGGTPTLLPVAMLADLLARIERKTRVTPSRVYAAIELAPSDAENEMLDFLKNSGFQRLSVGVQSFSTADLKALGRPQPARLIHTALARIAQKGFSGFNVDLIYGIPGQTAARWQDSLHQALDYGPSELFVYPLYARPFTALAGLDLDTGLMQKLYRLSRDLLTENGYAQISMRRFVRMDTRDLSFSREEKDCGFERTLSLGCGGRSYLDDLHLCEPFVADAGKRRRLLLEFMEKEDFLSAISGFMLNQDEHKRRYMIKNLLHVSGVKKNRYKDIFGKMPEQDFPFLHKLAKQGKMEITANQLRLTETGLEQSDTIGPLFISDAVAGRTNAGS